MNKDAKDTEGELEGVPAVKTQGDTGVRQASKPGKGIGGNNKCLYNGFQVR